MFAKQFRSTKSRSTKTMYLRARFTKMVDLHKGCSTNLSLVELEKITHHCHWLHEKWFVLFSFLAFLLNHDIAEHRSRWWLPRTLEVSRPTC